MHDTSAIYTATDVFLFVILGSVEPSFRPSLERDGVARSYFLLQYGSVLSY